MPSLSQTVAPAVQPPETRPEVARQPAGRGNAFAQDQLRQGTEAPCTTDGPRGDYVTMGPADKAAYLAELFRTQGAQTTFADRGFNRTDQSQLAAIMQNEGGTNERRGALGGHYASSARSLTKKLTAAGYKDLTQLAAAGQDRKLSLTEDERAVLAASQQGKVDLVALGGTGAGKQQASAALTQVGIDHQTAMYSEFSGLDGRKRSGEKLSKEESSRLGSLGGRSLYSSGKFSDARGMSEQRFRGVYDEGQTRFEPSRYAKSRNAVERWESGGEKGKGGKVGAGGESASDWVGRHPEARTGNHDALADAETSWGTAQIMGHYADRGNLHKADGSNYNMDDMRSSGARRSPNATDVDMQISYFRDIANVPRHLGNADELAVQYNGPGAPPSYADGLRNNAARYDRAREGLTGDCPPDRRAALDSEPRLA